MLGNIVAIYEVGCAVGALGAFLVGEKLGRKKTLSLGAIIMAIGAVLQATPFGRGQMLAARVISGLGMGAINSTAPVLQAEVSPRASRGRFVCAQLSMLNFAIALSYWIGEAACSSLFRRETYTPYIAVANAFICMPRSSADYGTTKHFTTSFAWRFPIAFQLVFIVPIFVLSLFCIESPRWLENHGRHEEALKVVGKLVGRPTTDQEVIDRHTEIAEAARYERENTAPGWGALFANDRLSTRRRLLIACSVQL